MSLYFFHCYISSFYLHCRIFHLCFIGDSLESPQWLILAFLPHNFGRWWGPIKDIFAVIQMQLEQCGQSKVMGTLKPYLLLKKFELFALSDGRDAKLQLQALTPWCEPLCTCTHAQRAPSGISTTLLFVLLQLSNTGSLTLKIL